MTVAAPSNLVLSEPALRANGYDVLGDRRRCIQERGAGQRIGMVADIPAVGALNHDDARVMVDGDDAHRNPCEQLAHDVAMPQRIDGDFLWVERGGPRNTSEWPAVL